MDWVKIRIYLDYDMKYIYIKRYERKLHLKDDTEHPPIQVGEKNTFHFEVAFRFRLNVETLTLILKPQSLVFLDGLIFWE